MTAKDWHQGKPTETLLCHQLSLNQCLPEHLWKLLFKLLHASRQDGLGAQASAQPFCSEGELGLVQWTNRAPDSQIQPTRCKE